MDRNTWGPISIRPSLSQVVVESEISFDVPINYLFNVKRHNYITMNYRKQYERQKTHVTSVLHILFYKQLHFQSQPGVASEILENEA